MKKQILFVALLPLLAPVVVPAQDTIAPATTQQKADESNARLELARAANALVGKETFGAKPSLESERKLVADNVDALLILRAALRLPFRAVSLPEPEQASQELLEEIMTDNMEMLADYRRMARLLVTESRVRAADKDFAGAVQSARDGQRLGVLVRSDGQLIQMMSGVAIEAIARRQLRELLPQLDAANAKLALGILQSETSAAPTYAQTLRYEAAWNRISYPQMWEGLTQPVTQQMSAELERLMEREIAQSGVPYIISEQQARVDTMSEEFIEGLGDDVTVPDAITVEMVPALFAAQFAMSKSLYRSSRFLYENNRAQNALLLADFALHAYQLEHGTPATDWDEIVPKYLPPLLADPFDYEHSLRLTSRDGKAVAYSIGPDGLDDKGAPIDNGIEAGARRFRVEFNNRGDIVSGVNVQ